MSSPVELLRQALDAFDEQIAALAEQLEELGVQRAKVAELLGLGDEGDPPAAPASARPSGGSPKRHVCPECGRTCANGTGLAAHMRSAHAPGASTRAATDPAPAPADGSASPSAGASGGKAYVCDDCGKGFVNVDRLSDHVFKDHKMRPMTAAEKAGR